MIASDYSTDKIEFKYQWSIKNFTDHFTVMNRSKPVKTEFRKPWTKKLTFSSEHIDYSLRLIANSDYVKWYLDIHSISEWLTLAYELSILNKNGVPFRTMKRNIVDDNKTGSFTITQINTSELQSKEFIIFDDKALKMTWSVMIHDQKKPKKLITPTYIPKQHKLIKDNFEELLKSEHNSDVIFEVDGKEFKAHKFILMARSPVFSTMFSIDMTEKETNRVKIVDISSSIFEVLLYFIYTDQIMIKLNFATGMDLLKAASKYQLEGLEALCEAELFQLLTPGNAMKVLAMAEKNHLDYLVKIITDFVQKHLEVVSSW